MWGRDNSLPVESRSNSQVNTTTIVRVVGSQLLTRGSPIKWHCGRMWWRDNYLPVESRLISQVNTTTIVRVVGSQLLTRGSLINIFENQFSLVNRLPEDSIAVSILQDYAPHGDYNIAEVMVIMATYWWLWLSWLLVVTSGYLMLLVTLRNNILMTMVIMVIDGYLWLLMYISNSAMVILVTIVGGYQWLSVVISTEK